mmetsp:Transcript_85446/g.276704  ORF Transcript_85446/g.276704 Transcript_85446/m.276704 type:complete len:263 (-) Transcript_85446:356-1144(-)
MATGERITGPSCLKSPTRKARPAPFRRARGTSTSASMAWAASSTKTWVNQAAVGSISLLRTYAAAVQVATTTRWSCSSASSGTAKKPVARSVLVKSNTLAERCLWSLLTATSRSISDWLTPCSASFSQSRSDAGLEGAVTRILAEGCCRRIAMMVCTSVVVFPVPGGPQSSSGGSGNRVRRRGCRAAPRKRRCSRFRCSCSPAPVELAVVDTRHSGNSNSSMARCIVRSGVRLKENWIVNGGRFWKVLLKETLILSRSTWCT